MKLEISVPKVVSIFKEINEQPEQLYERNIPKHGLATNNNYVFYIKTIGF